jgi:GTP 3',8-cyclase
MEVDIHTRELRLLVTQRCNYNCVFCHGEGLQNLQKDRLNSDDFAYIFKIGKNFFGFNSVTITGGEPMVREDLIEIVKKIKEQGGRIVLTTNGFFLKDKIEIGNYIDRINVSIHSLNNEDYNKIVRVENGFDKVITGLFYFRQNYPNVEIRLNSTLIRGVNASKEKIEQYVDLASKLGASIKFVELFPKEADGFFPLEEAEKIIIGLGFSKTSSEDRKMDFRRENSFIRLSKVFCAFAENLPDPCKLCKKYNDLFINPEGSIKPCRSQLRVINALEDIKNRNDEKLAEKIKNSLNILGDKCPYLKH